MNATTTKTNEVARINRAKFLTFFAIDPALSDAERIAKTREALAELAGIAEQ